MLRTCSEPGRVVQSVKPNFAVQNRVYRTTRTEKSSGLGCGGDFGAFFLRNPCAGIAVESNTRIAELSSWNASAQ